jgi:hypothetical protein
MDRQSIMSQKKGRGRSCLGFSAVQIIAVNSKSLVQINFPENP